jgi:hypothetical protein
MIILIYISLPSQELVLGQVSLDGLESGFVGGREGSHFADICDLINIIKIFILIL